MVKQINAYKDYMHEAIHSTIASEPLNINIGTLFPKLFKPYDIYMDGSTGVLTIDNLRAAAYRGAYTPNDCEFFADIVKKYVDSISDKAFKEYAAGYLSKMDKQSETSIKETCEKITVRYDMLTRINPDMFPPYGVLKWNDTFQYITKCGAMSYDTAKARNVKMLSEDAEYNKQHRIKVSRAEIASYGKSDYKKRDQVRDYIIDASMNTEGIDVCLVPDEGLDIFIRTDEGKLKYIPLPMDLKDISQIRSNAIRQSVDQNKRYGHISAKDVQLIEKFLENYNKDAEFTRRRYAMSKLDPPVEYTKEMYEADKRKEMQQKVARRELMHSGTSVTI